eukprot:Clim_evm5s224 gene=Clim_evmTU5s224
MTNQSWSRSWRDYFEEYGRRTLSEQVWNAPLQLNEDAGTWDVKNCERHWNALQRDYLVLRQEVPLALLTSDESEDSDAYDADRELLIACADVRKSEANVSRRIQKALYMGADPDITTSQGISAMFLCAISGKDMGLVALLAHGANPNSADQRGWTPLHAAVSGGHTICTFILLRAGADESAKCNDGLTPALLADAQSINKNGRSRRYLNSAPMRLLRAWGDESVPRRYRRYPAKNPRLRFRYLTGRDWWRTNRGRLAARILYSQPPDG